MKKEDNLQSNIEEIENSESYLCFIKYIGTNSNGNEYEFYFTTNLEDFWGDNFNTRPAMLINDLTPYDNCYTEIKRITLNDDLLLDLASHDSSHSFQDCIDDVIALAAQNIDSIDYPEDGRLIFHFGENFNQVEEKLSKIGVFFT
jgi:hypothetical protein